MLRLARKASKFLIRDAETGQWVLKVCLYVCLCVCPLLVCACVCMCMRVLHLDYARNVLDKVNAVVRIFHGMI